MNNNKKKKKKEKTKKTETISSMCSDHNGLKLETNLKEKLKNIQIHGGLNTSDLPDWEVSSWAALALRLPEIQ